MENGTINQGFDTNTIKGETMVNEFGTKRSIFRGVAIASFLGVLGYTSWNSNAGKRIRTALKKARQYKNEAYQEIHKSKTSY